MIEDSDRPGALVLSIDLEGIWGVRDRVPPDGGSYRKNLEGNEKSVTGTLELFKEFSVKATWAPVGMMMASSREELGRYLPDSRPGYTDRRLDPYGDRIGDSEEADPFRLAPSLINNIRNTPGQEIATQTFCHYYALEPGQTEENFREDLNAAIRIGRKWGIETKSIVFPRNQVNKNYFGVLQEVGIETFRGNESGWMHRPRPGRNRFHPARIARILDSAYPRINGKCQSWSEVIESSGLANVRAGRFLRPVTGKRSLDRLVLGSARQLLQKAAREAKILHLWWHPENYGVDTEENLARLRVVLEDGERLASEWGLQSLTMQEVGRLARG